jgi:hypothetical protein
MHLGAASAWPWEGRASHRVLDGVGRYSGGMTLGEAAICLGEDQSLDDGQDERRRERHAGSPEQALSHA